MRADGEQLKTLAALYDAGALHPVLDRTFPFDETLDAMAYVEQGRAKGKIVVTMPLLSSVSARRYSNGSGLNTGWRRP
jgi:hypothetical protein